ncbi:putative SnoaL-like aldol condensation-catalyzing enzyme [Luteibacter rhizovicinus]|uniref:Putative SnoaL-like aldol condensation-catalyzing enzyme n=1 Tax=Luteibacter rhizovicinus TaxID=242606 RepID=A0A4R3YY57_9GAMM|nr:nuclear transport factor 2 family protein [Luteibacter rhizovicinus]TCV97526.1 putative SnoaL-like aldol condensation-catalyzing enzyme [Luteibacter rhizovicinus]
MTILQQESNRKLVTDVMRKVFVERDVAHIDRWFSPAYVQHNPAIPDGRDAIAKLVAALPAEFSYEMGMSIAEGDLVMVHGRYVGWESTPVIAVDIFRVENGVLVEHWDVMQTEVPAGETRSGNAMFGR